MYLLRAFSLCASTGRPNCIFESTEELKQREVVPDPTVVEEVLPLLCRRDLRRSPTHADTAKDVRWLAQNEHVAESFPLRSSGNDDDVSGSDPASWGIPLALASPPVIIEAIAPSDGSHWIRVDVEGLPFEILVRVPPKAKPGERVSIDLGAPPDFEVRVPSSSGKIYHDGLEFDVPEHLGPGDYFKVTPPSMTVKAPCSCVTGQPIAFRGGPGLWEDQWLCTLIPPWVVPGECFPVRLPPGPLNEKCIRI
ncbi:Uncharacterized protein SCF082_LOCUS30739 [Durusdinium trenchii]|uniref:Uncharacterized protein n=1 Tax=Durusdinium trenchii TaxID=1381693 RepID=A0ABP0N0C6_9DINO